MPSVTVYTLPNCPQCTATKRALDKNGIAYSVIDLSQDVAAREHLRQLGYMQAPVVITTGETWSGYRPDRIKNIATA